MRGGVRSSGPRKSTEPSWRVRQSFIACRSRRARFTPGERRRVERNVENTSLKTRVFAHWRSMKEHARRQLDARATFYRDSQAITFSDEYLDANCFRDVALLRLRAATTIRRDGTRRYVARETRVRAVARSRPRGAFQRRRRKHRAPRRRRRNRVATFLTFSLSSASSRPQAVAYHLASSASSLQPISSPWSSDRSSRAWFRS